MQQPADERPASDRLAGESAKAFFPDRQRAADVRQFLDHDAGNIAALWELN